jgi:hypothetical protein
MVRVILAALALAALPAAALAQPQRIADGSYVSAARCVALAELPQLASDSPDVTVLRESLAIDRSRRAEHLRNQADDAARRVRIQARRSDAALLRIRRDAACAAFTDRGLVSASVPGQHRVN